jgi:phosphosulfolactate synthase
MNFTLSHVPDRTPKPRNSGFTMAMDKGLSVREAQDLMATSAAFIDIIKLGWATSYLTPGLEEKIEVYTKAGVPTYLGGTLFEAFIVRDQFSDYLDLIKRLGLTYAEVSDGSIDLPHPVKCAYIEKMAKHVTVLSEVGSKDAEKIIPPYKWIELMKRELESGAWKVIGEAREGGNVGLFRSSGEVREGLVEEILTQVPFESIIWEAPQKSQQVFFIKLLGPNVNLGNIAPSEIIPLETIRLGLRGDTFGMHLNGQANRKNWPMPN